MPNTGFSGGMEVMEQELTEARAIIAATEAKHNEETSQFATEIQLLEQQMLAMRTTIAQVSADLPSYTRVGRRCGDCKRCAVPVIVCLHLLSVR